MTNVSGKSVLLLGDSHTFGSYGTSLEKLFKAAGADVTRVGWVGAAAIHYLNGKERTLKLGGTGDFAAAASRPWDVVVVSLGTNDAAALAPGQSAAEAAERIRTLAYKLQAKSLWYVGPPAFSDNAAKTYNPAFAKESLKLKAERLWDEARNRFPNAIDPRSVTAPFVSAKDIHLGPKGGAAWARRVFDTIAGEQVTLAPGEKAPSSGGSGVGLVLAAVAVVAGVVFVMRRRAR